MSYETHDHLTVSPYGREHLSFIACLSVPYAAAAAATGLLLSCDAGTG